MSDQVAPFTSIGFGSGPFGRGPYVAQVLTATLALTQANETISAGGTVAFPVITGALAATQANETLSAAGVVRVGGALGLTQANETLAAAGTVSIGGTLGLPQAAQTLAAAAGGGIIGTLSAPQAAQTVAATAGPVVSGTLPGAAAATTWNPADLTAVTLSNGNLTATPNGACGVRSIASISAGKYYFEFTYGTGNVTGSLVGLANASATLSTVATTCVNAVICNGSGQVAANNTTVLATVGAFSSGLTCCVAVDMGAQRIWFRNGAAGSWNATSGTANNPATGTGGISFSGLTAGTASLYALYAATALTAGVATANFGATAFVGAVPSGFTAGFPSASSAPTQAAETLSGAGVVLSGIAASLNLVQASQTLSATGVGQPITLANLAVTQGLQSLSAAGTVRVGATLGVAQAPQTLVASAGPVMRATLVATQDPEHLAAAGIVLQSIVGSLVVTQAPQTLGAAGVVLPVLTATLGVTQDDQTATALAGYPHWQSWQPCAVGEWIPVGSAVGYGRGGYGMGPFGGIKALPAPETGTWQTVANCETGTWAPKRLAA